MAFSYWLLANHHSLITIHKKTKKMIELYDPTENEPKPNSEFERIISDILASIILFLIEPFVFSISFFYYMIKDKIDNIRHK